MNALLTKEAGKVLGDMLKGNSILKELDVSSNFDYGAGATDGPGFAHELFGGIKDNGALTSLDVSNNYIGQLVYSSGGKGGKGRGKGRGKGKGKGKGKGGRVFGKGKGSGEHGKPKGAIAIANTIKDMGAMASLHVGSNGIPEKEMREIMDIAASKESMKILCEVPFKDKTITALDVSGKKLGAEGALVVAEYLDGNGAMTSLNLASNSLGVKGAKIVAAFLPKCT
jgi:hypothetical protein